MSSLGQLEVIRADKSFDTETAQPALPGLTHSGRGTTVHASTATSAKLDVESVAVANLEETLETARLDVRYMRSSTTVTSLALALECVGEVEASVEAASEALEMCVEHARKHGLLNDPISARLSLEVLLRAGKIDQAIAYVHGLPLTGQARLIIGAMLAGADRLAEARRLIDGSDTEGSDAVRGFLLVLEGGNEAAVSSLREALRSTPDDADSALNLSIAFWRIGAKKKSIEAALRATRTAPGRQDVALHYLELLLAEKDFDRFDREISSFEELRVVPSARLLVLQARAKLVRGDVESGLQLLDRASEVAKSTDDLITFAEVQSNLIRIRAWNRKLDREIAVSRLFKLHEDFPSLPVVVVSMAQVANRRRHAEKLRAALTDVIGVISPARRAFVEHQLATLEGQNELATKWAIEWYTLEPEDPNASVAVVVSLGIGEERWEEAAEYARVALQKYPEDRIQVNNAAYVLAMTGEGAKAVELLEPFADGDFVMTATLGLAYLSAGQTNIGMKLYRQAANLAEKARDASRSLMTAYQALVVNQLGLLESGDLAALTAMSLPPVDLPDDWREKSEFLRLHTLSLSKGYGWPLSL